MIALALFIISVSSVSFAADATVEDLEKRVTDLEKKTSDISTKQEHTDKHISHLKEVAPRAID
jgi:chaperonin cofactor prefoldin